MDFRFPLLKRPSSSIRPSCTAFGLLVRREHWSLSWRGRCLVLLLVVGGIFTAHWVAYPFLAVNQPLHGEVLIVEGWIPVYTLHQVAAEATNGCYRRVLIARALYEGEPGVEHGRLSAEYAVTVLTRCGVPESAIETVLFSGAQQDRTYHSALAVKQRLAETDSMGKSIDVITLGPHARRSRLLYQKAFGNATRVGVIALPDSAYDARHWWRASEGVREVVGESLAYLYARLSTWN